MGGAEPMDSPNSWTVNSAFLEETKELHGELWNALAELERMCAVGLEATGHCFEIVARLADVRDKISMQFSLEEAYGYTLGQESGELILSQIVERLKRQHRELYLAIATITEDAEQLLYERNMVALATITIAEFQQFLDSFYEHEELEWDLIQCLAAHPASEDDTPETLPNEIKTTTNPTPDRRG